jgi:hypothetical protein
MPANTTNCGECKQTMPVEANYCSKCGKKMQADACLNQSNFGQDKVKEQNEFAGIYPGIIAFIPYTLKSVQNMVAYIVLMIMPNVRQSDHCGTLLAGILCFGMICIVSSLIIRIDLKIKNLNIELVHNRLYKTLWVAIGALLPPVYLHRRARHIYMHRHAQSNDKVIPAFIVFLLSVTIFTLRFLGSLDLIPKWIAFGF